MIATPVLLPDRVGPSQWRLRPVPRLLLGLALYGVADAMMIRAAIGVDPWTVFAQGLARQTGLGIGLLTNVIGLLVLLLWIPLRQRPGLGTVLNVLVVGTMIDVGLHVLPVPEEWWARGLSFAGGLLLLAVASGVYIGAHLGPGPRDGLMLGLHARLGVRIWIARSGVELSVLLVGWLLGGDVGVGTLLFAVLIGPLCSVTLPLLGVRHGTAPAEAEGGRYDEGPARNDPDGALATTL
ncbi:MULTISPECIES: YczE/YyaS/YitT family protein [unclassified Rathayibacter]|uniref:membrane protein YczE n=1 Tax=unclassified Rathayibacter TaxID=2609250 RepID=UPI00188C5013|nr:MULTISPECIES: hypothetical protein [unclassified Rathayibacter]MBF4461463.1 hypothetical protein [Rathayibacter sp. VKM Ac-2879]MBF4502874.1 hypothetical protein [Rathayibacter sp. VKM Ac-2878]